MYKHTLALVFLLLSSSIFAQVEIPCITDEILADKIKNDPTLALKQHASDQAILNYGRAARKKDGGCDIRIIPCVFHIIHTNGTENIGDNIVEQYVQQVNDVFGLKNIAIDDIDTAWQKVVANMQVELRLAKLDPNGNPTNGIVRVESSQSTGAFDNVKDLSRWDPERYLNIWIVRTINYPGANGTVLGYAYFPFMENDEMTNSGIVIRSDVLNRATLPHELGHYLNLYHPFQGSCGSDCQLSGDRVCDTPPVIESTSGCPLANNTCSNDFPYDQRDMIENIMDYSSCRNIMTLGQKARVDATLENDRAKLVSIDNLYKTGVLDSTYIFGKPIADFSAETIEICEGGTVDYFDLSCTDIEKTDYKWIFPSGVPSAAFTQNAEVEYSKAGTYDATLIISNDAGSDTLVKKNFIKVIPEVSSLKAPLSLNFEDNGFPYEGWRLNDATVGNHWETTDLAARNGSSSIYISNHGEDALSNQPLSFFTPEIDLSTAKTFQLSFDVAYARSSAGSTERLEVYAISPCRNVVLLRYQASAFSLKTVDLVTTPEFIPKEGEWKTIDVDLNLIKSFTSVSFEFRFVSNGDQNIYIDNLHIGDWSAGINDISNSIELFPNPASSTLSIQGLSQFENVNLSIYDVSGRIMSVHLAFKKNDINISSLEKGAYYIRLETEKGSFNTAFIKN